MLGRLWGRGPRRPTRLDSDAVVEVDGVRYDARALTRPERRGGVWAGWSGRIRRAFAALTTGAAEARAVTEVPWAVGGTLSSPSSSQDRALRMGPVFSAVRLIADHVSTLPVKAYRKAGGKRIPRNGLPELFFRLDEDGQLIPWLKRCVTSLMLRGNAYGLITSRDDLGFPLVIQWLDPSDVSCNDVNPWVPIWYWMGREIPREDLLHIPWFVIAGKAQGLSPIEAYALTTNTGLKAQEYGTTWFDNGGVPPGTFKNTRKEIDQNAANTISDRLVSAVRSRRPIVYGADWDYNAIVIPPEQAQFIQTLSMTATQIAAIYGLPPEMIGGSTGDPMTYKTEEQFQARLNSALRPLLVLLESAFSSILPRYEQVKLNADATARADLKTRYEAYEIAKRIGLLTDDEIRALEDLPPLPPGQRPTPVSPQAPEPQPARRDYDPNQPRDEDGKWGHGGIALLEAPSKVAGLVGQDALDAVPATLTPDPRGHGGQYDNATLDGPPGGGSAQALSAYEGVEYQRINDLLRADRDKPSEYIQGQQERYGPTIADIDKTMAVSRLKSDVVVQRALKDGRAVFGDAWYGEIVDWNGKDRDRLELQIGDWKAGARPDLTGLKWTERGYVSTTADPAIATDVYAAKWTASNAPLEGEPIVLNIRVPKGTGAVQLSPMGKEAEILLERGLTIEIIADHGVDFDGVRQLDALVTPATAAARAFTRLGSARASGSPGEAVDVPPDPAARAEDRITGDYPVPVLSEPSGGKTVKGTKGAVPVRPRGASPTRSGHQAALYIRARAFPPPSIARPLRAVS